MPLSVLMPKQHILNSAAKSTHGNGVLVASSLPSVNGVNGGFPALSANQTFLLRGNVSPDSPSCVIGGLLGLAKSSAPSVNGSNGTAHTPPSPMFGPFSPSNGTNFHQKPKLIDAFDLNGKAGSISDPGSSSDEDEKDGRGGKGQNSKRSKKHRLQPEQLAVLQATFKVNDRLDAATKQYLSQKLNLPARQIEVWFQNCRVRVKKKRTEERCLFYKSQYQKQLQIQQNLDEENKRLSRENAQLRQYVKALLVSATHTANPDALTANLVAANLLPGLTEGDVADQDAPLLAIQENQNAASPPASNQNSFSSELSFVNPTAQDAQSASTDARNFAHASPSTSKAQAQIVTPPCGAYPDAGFAGNRQACLNSPASPHAAQQQFNVQLQRTQSHSSSPASPGVPPNGQVPHHQTQGASANVHFNSQSSPHVSKASDSTAQKQTFPLGVNHPSSPYSAQVSSTSSATNCMPTFATSATVAIKSQPESPLYLNGALHSPQLSSCLPPVPAASHTASRDVALRTMHSALELFQRRASSAEDVTRLMNDLCLIVSKTLGSGYVKILELLQGGEFFLLRSGVGWRDGLVGHALVGCHTQSQAGYAVMTNRPVIVENYHTETRFNWPTLHQGHGVFSGVSVVVATRFQPRPYGVLGLHSASRRMFTHNEVNFLQGMAQILADMIDRINIPKVLSECARFSNSFLLHSRRNSSTNSPNADQYLPTDHYASSTNHVSLPGGPHTPASNADSFLHLAQSLSPSYLNPTSIASTTLTANRRTSLAPSLPTNPYLPPGSMFHSSHAHLGSQYSAVSFPSPALDILSDINLHPTQFGNSPHDLFEDDQHKSARLENVEDFMNFT